MSCFRLPLYPPFSSVSLSFFILLPLMMSCKVMSEVLAKRQTTLVFIFDIGTINSIVKQVSRLFTQHFLSLLSVYRIFDITLHDIISGRRMKKERDTEENLVFSFLKFSAAKGSCIPLNTKQSLTQLCGK